MHQIHVPDPDAPDPDAPDPRNEHYRHAWGGLIITQTAPFPLLHVPSQQRTLLPSLHGHMETSNYLEQLLQAVLLRLQHPEGDAHAVRGQIQKGGQRAASASVALETVCPLLRLRRACEEERGRPAREARGEEAPL